MSAAATDASSAPLRILIALPGLHAVQRGAEVVFENLADEIAKIPGYQVTLVGSGQPDASRGYAFKHVGCVSRERFLRFPRVPLLRSEYAYEELTFAAAMAATPGLSDFDVTVTCGYPFASWMLRAKGLRHGAKHIYVTENGDWAPRRENSEYKLFHADGLICTNVEYQERHAERWRSALIPNGVNTARFGPGEPSSTPLYSVPDGLPVVLIVAALIESKRVVPGIEALAGQDDIAVVVAGNGPLADEVERAGRAAFGERFDHIVLGPDQMPDLYRSADVLLHMSKVEPFGNIYIEALASGLPVVAHDTPNTRWITGGHASLVDTEDPGAVVSAVRGCLEADAPEAPGARSRYAGERFDWAVVARQYCDYFDRVCGRPARG